MNWEECTESSTNREIPVEENRVKFIVLNNGGRTIHKVTVDGCLIGEKKEKCDYIFEIMDNNEIDAALYVELKGKKIKKACGQLAATLGHCKARHGQVDKSCYIVCSRVPLARTEFQNLKKNFRTKNKVPLFIKEKLFKYKA